MKIELSTAEVDLLARSLLVHSCRVSREAIDAPGYEKKALQDHQDKIRKVYRKIAKERGGNEN